MTNQKNPLLFIFPGQGSQAVGMGKFLFDNFTSAKNVFEEASDAISLNLKKLCFEGDEKNLSLTENTQPALLTVSVATAFVLKKEFEIQATMTAGHSIGEYSSFVLGQALTFTDAVKSVRERGLAMQNAVPVGKGGMTATLGLDQKQVEFLCQWAVKYSGHGPLSPANYNCDGQIVISGNQQTLNWLKDHFNADIFPEHNLERPTRAKLIPLQVSAPFHCTMMQPAEDKMREHFKKIEFKNSQMSIYQNFHAVAETDHSILKENLIRQISAPVLWTQSMNEVKKNYSNHQSLQVIECGHGQVLKGLLKKIDAEYFKVHSAHSLDDLKSLQNLF
jgi:[acyl-carrier-protein] S-malonyltransferase